MPSIRRASVSFDLSADYLGDITGVEQYIPDSFKATISNGTGTNQANRAYKITTTIAPSGSYTLNLSSFTDNIGNACALTKLVALFISHGSSSLSSGVTLGGGTNPLFGTKVVGLEVLAGNTQPFAFRQGYAVSSGSADRVRIVNTDAVNSATITLVLLGSQ